jgi:predicted ATPase
MIFLIVGAPGSGKTTLARALMQRFDRGIHIPVDDLREWVVSGCAHPTPEWTDETAVQFELAERSSADLAARYFDAGIAAAIDHIANPDHLEERIVSALAPRPVLRVMLVPTLEVNLDRNASRKNKEFDPGLLVKSIHGLHRACLEYDNSDWIKIDNSSLSVEGTVDLILAQLPNMVDIG